MSKSKASSIWVFFETASDEAIGFLNRKERVDSIGKGGLEKFGRSKFLP